MRPRHTRRVSSTESPAWARNDSHALKLVTAPSASARSLRKGGGRAASSREKTRSASSRLQRAHEGERVRHRRRQVLVEARGAARVEDASEDARAHGDERVEALGERPVGADHLDVGEDALGLARGGGGEEARVVLEVEVDDARRDAGALGHLFGRRLERAFVDQVEQGVDDGGAGALGARGASVDLGLARPPPGHAKDVAVSLQ